jgi:hypothetical protein
MSRTIQRPSVAALALVVTTLVVGLVTLVVPAGSASAAAYRYWGYFQLNGTTWQFATKGPDQLTPADGSVEGWRFAVAGESDTRTPRVTTTFDAICGATAAKSGSKRVAVVIDYGRPADQADGSTPPPPVGRCAVVPTAATGAEVLAAVATVRSQDKLVCALDGIPATGCGDAVKTVPAAAAAADTPTTLPPNTPSATASPVAASTSSDVGTSFWKYAGIGFVVLALVALGAVLVVRRAGSSRH